MKQPENFVDAVSLFMQTGGNTVEGFNCKQTALYISLVLEEARELIETINTSINHSELETLIEQLNLTGEMFANGYFNAEIQFANRTELLDAALDLAVVSVGTSLSVATDAPSAAREVMRANLAKFPNGQVIRNAAGKIQKPEGWAAPNLDPYV